MAKPFRLQPVLDLRQRRTETLEQEVAIRKRAEIAIEARVDAMRTELAAQRRELQRLQQPGRTLNLRAIQFVLGYIDTLERRLVEHTERLTEARAATEAKRVELIAAHRDQQALETLKDRELARIHEAAKRDEQLTTDELATVGFNYRRKTA
ncbi:MAG: flagellar export protein FliJ [Dehalococcoidia bacterium]|nr:flagellar export protein FliJ [Dehalococcoidia bacterium]